MIGSEFTIQTSKTPRLGEPLFRMQKPSLLFDSLFLEQFSFRCILQKATLREA